MYYFSGKKNITAKKEAISFNDKTNETVREEIQGAAICWKHDKLKAADAIHNPGLGLS